MTRPVIMLLATAVAATALAACGGGSFSTKTTAYIPKKVENTAVDKNSDLAKKVAESFQKDKETIGDVAGGTVGKNCQGVVGFPDLQLAAMRSKDKSGVSEAALDALGKQLSSDPSVKQRKQTIDGVSVRTVELNADDPSRGVALAFATPRPDAGLILYSVAYCGGMKKAVAGMTAMLDAGQS